MSNAVLYYSFGGNTKFMAKIISKKIDADIISINEIKRRKKGFGFATGAIFSLLSLGSKIETLPPKVNESEMLFIGTPVWAGHSTPALNSALKSISFENKKVYLFSTSAGGDSQSKKPFKSLKKRIEMAGGVVVSSFSLQFGGKRVNPADMKNLVELWIEKILK